MSISYIYSGLLNAFLNILRWENMLFKNPLAAGLAVNNDNLIATNQLNDEMRKTANELLDSMQDSRFSETEVINPNSFFISLV